MNADDSLLNEFLQESCDHLATIESDLLAMEEGGANTDDQLVNKVFRAAHSIKGGSGFFGLESIQRLAHRIESSLDLIRCKEMVPTAEVVNILLVSFDRLREMINNPKASDGVDISDLMLALSGLASSFLPEGEKHSMVTAVPLPGPAHLVSLSEFDLKRATKGGKFIYLLEVDLFHDVHRQGKTPWAVFKDLMSCGVLLDCAWNLEAAGTLDDGPAKTIPIEILYASVMDVKMLTDLVKVPAEHITIIPPSGLPATPPLKASPLITPEAPRPTPPAPAPTAASIAAPDSPVAAGGVKPTSSGSVELTVGDSTLRVNISVLEQLMNLAGEMVLGRNQLLEAIARQDTRAIGVGAQRINLVTSELQEAIMLTRMQPVGNVLNKFPRVVRDLSRELGKDIRLSITGREVEIDRAILEGLSDPLTHMIRNAVDHGVGTPEERQAAGKSPVGLVEVSVYHEAGQVVVRIKDDGKGLDVARIAAKAVEKGLITQDQAKAMSHKERMGLIFLPGLSTAEKLSNVSGRGVGMDVVRTNIEKLGGTIGIDSELGHGTDFQIKLPLTLAIVPSLLVSESGERFAIPQVNVTELIRLPPEQVRERIEVVGETEVLLLRGELIPLIRLADVLGIERTYADGSSGARLEDRRAQIADRRGRRFGLTGASTSDQPSEAPVERTGGDRRAEGASDLSVVVVNAGLIQYGIVVEALHDTVEIVVKPLGKHLKSLREYAGATILGDGGVALIVDVVSLAGILGLTGQGGTDRAQDVSNDHLLDRFKDRHAFLLFRNGPDEPCAVPLEQVARVERIEASQVEGLGGRRTMAYRGGILPLITLKDAAQVAEIPTDANLLVIVFALGGREVGLIGALPVDSVEIDVTVDRHSHRQPGISGSAIIQGQTTMVVDMHELVTAVLPERMAESASTRKARTEGLTLLLAEDSDFFRHQVQNFLEGDGYTVLSAPDGQAAWELLQEHAETIQGVVSDIEMPRMTGLEFVTKIRAEARFQSLPVIALTSLVGEEDIARGKALGFTDYQVKLDRDRLLESLHKHLPRLKPSNAPSDHL